MTRERCGFLISEDGPGQRNGFALQRSAKGRAPVDGYTWKRTKRPPDRFSNAKSMIPLGKPATDAQVMPPNLGVSTPDFFNDVTRFWLGRILRLGRATCRTDDIDLCRVLKVQKNSKGSRETCVSEFQGRPRPKKWLSPPTQCIGTCPNGRIHVKNKQTSTRPAFQCKVHGPIGKISERRSGHGTGFRRARPLTSFLCPSILAWPNTPAWTCHIQNR